jgi:hypothetical protein
VVVKRHAAGSQASGRAAGLFKSVQADELRTSLARRSIGKAISFGDWAGVPLEVARSGSFLIARTQSLGGGYPVHLSRRAHTVTSGSLKTLRLS